jgi:ABC-type nitrate/sulfonate/bicarbonate transport system substrate-binding protein
MTISTSWKARAFTLALGFIGATTPLAAQADEITLGLPGGMGPTDMPAVFALDALKEQGWDAKYIEFDSPDILTQALLNGDVQVALMGPSTVFAADMAGADLKMIAKNNKIDLLVATTAKINACADLDGKVVAYHSTGSTSTAHLMRYLSDTCPDAKPNFMVLSGSGNRAAALLDGQIDGTIVRLEDWLAVTGGEDPRVKVLAMLADNQSSLLTQAVVVTGRGLEDEGEAITAYIHALNGQFAAVYADPAAFAKKAAPLLDGATEETMIKVYKALADSGLFPKGEAFEPGMVADTITFYEQSGRVEAGKLTPDAVADYSLAGS